MPLDVQEMRVIAERESTVSGKIRALDKAGVPRADIARFLGRRYQHIRNVLEADRQKAAGGGRGAVDKLSDQTQSGDLSDRLRTGAGSEKGRAGPPIHAIFRLRTNADGTLLVPRQALDDLGIGGNEVVMAAVEGDRLNLMSATTSMRRAQELVQRLIPGNDSLADSLIADRRREVELEQDTEQEATGG